VFREITCLFPRKRSTREKKIPTDFFEGPGGLRRLHQGKAAQRLLGQVPIDQLLLDRFKDCPALTLQVDEKVMDALRKDADPPQTPHVGSDMNGIDPLPGGVHAEHFRQGFRRDSKKLPVQAFLGNELTKCPEGLGAQILGLVGFAGNVQGVVPLEIKGKLGYGLLVRQIVHLLEDQRTKGGIDLFGRPAETLRVAGGDFVNGQFGKDMLPEQTGPGSV